MVWSRTWHGSDQPRSSKQACYRAVEKSGLVWFYWNNDDALSTHIHIKSVTIYWFNRQHDTVEIDTVGWKRDGLMSMIWFSNQQWSVLATVFATPLLLLMPANMNECIWMARCWLHSWRFVSVNENHLKRCNCKIRFPGRQNSCIFPCFNRIGLFHSNILVMLGSR